MLSAENLELLRKSFGQEDQVQSPHGVQAQEEGDASESGAFSSCSSSISSSSALHLHGEACSNGASSSYHSRSTSSSATTTPSHQVAVARDPSGHSKGHSDSLDSALKWIEAALRHLNESTENLVIRPSLDPNDSLASRVHHLISTWAEEGKTAKDAGVDDRRDFIMKRPPPQKILSTARSWMRRYINLERAKEHVSVLPEKWAENLAGRRADTVAVLKVNRCRKAESGHLFHHKHDLAPSQEQLSTLCLSGWIGDGRVDSDILSSVETGMSVAIYFPTGARGKELKTMHLQSIGTEPIQQSKTGFTFHCIKLTAFETKTKEHHLNQFLPHSDPIRCGIGLLGLSVLIRVHLHGPPPFSTQMSEESWKVLGTSISTLDRRTKDLFNVAGIRRQTGDCITYLGRHYGTRILQHADGSTEGNAVRKGHSNGTAIFSYSECPLQDLLRLAGNFADTPFFPAHLDDEHFGLFSICDEILTHLFPSLAEEEKSLQTRMDEVDKKKTKAASIRKDELLLDREKFLKSIRLCCRVSLCCMVARPRTWAKWAIREEEITLWQMANHPQNRTIRLLFSGNEPAMQGMQRLASRVRESEEAELFCRRVGPGNQSSLQSSSSSLPPATVDITSVLKEVDARIAKRQDSMLEKILAAVGNLQKGQEGEVQGDGVDVPPLQETSSEEKEGKTTNESMFQAQIFSTSSVATPLPGTAVKRKRETQADVLYFSSWSSLSDAAEYVRESLYPLEKEADKNGDYSWRIRKKEDGVGQDKSRDKQWRCYRSLCIAAQRKIEEEGITEEASFISLQSLFDTFGSKAHTPFLRSIREGEMKHTKARNDSLFSAFCEKGVSRG